MSANPELLTLPRTPDSAGTSEPIPQPSDPPVATATGHRRTGKIARLPKDFRDKLDEMIEDGHPYELIWQALGALAKGLTDNNISNWKKGGHQDWLKNRFWCEEMRLRQEDFTDLLAGADAIKLPEAGLQLAATGACEILRDLCEITATPGRAVDPVNYVRVANSLARLSRSILTLQEYRDASAKAAAAQLSRKDPNREFNDAEYDLVTDRMDDFFRKPRRPRSGPSTAIVGQASTPAGSGASPPQEIPIPNPVGSPTAVTISATPAERPEGHVSNPPPSPVPNPHCAVGRASPPRETTFDCPAPSTLSLPPPLQPPPRVEPVPVVTPLPHIAPQALLDEFCLECGTRLPPLRDGGRIYARCGTCHIPLPPAGTCRFPSNEQCPKCKANLPRLRPSGHRPELTCQNCGTPLPPPDPTVHPPAPSLYDS